MRELLHTAQLVVMCMWPMTAFAAADSLSRVFTTHSTADWVALILLATVSGLVALLNRIRKNLEVETLEKHGKAFDEHDRLILSWKVFAGFHMTGSYMAGFIAFMLGEHFGVDGYLHALIIAFFAWMGAAVIDRMAAESSNWAARLINNGSSLGNPGINVNSNNRTNATTPQVAQPKQEPQ